MLHEHRASELNHLFLVNGNGYEWTKRGDLVSVCDEQFTKSGKPLSLNAAINRVFRTRKKHDEFRKRWTSNEKRKEKRAFTHSKTCTTVTLCNCGDLPHDPQCCFFILEDRKCNCGAQARIDAAKPQDAKIDAMIEKAIAETKAKREADPVGFEQSRLKHIEDFKALKRKWREEKKYEYRVPEDIDQRVAKQEPRPGAYGGYNNWYPVCQYAKIVGFPENIKNDWLLGVIEVCRLVIANPPVVTQYANENTIAETLKYVNEALDRAVAIAQRRRLKGFKEAPKTSHQEPETRNLTKVGQRVVIAKPVPWNGAAAAVASRPSVGLKGKIANPKKFPYPTPPEGKSAVQLKATDMGYAPSADPDRKYMILYIPTECLRAI